MNSASPLQLDNHFVRHLPADPEQRNIRRQVSKACYSRVQPLQFPRATLLGWSQPLAAQLGLSPLQLGEARFAQIFSGTELLSGSEPFAQCYGGHQFGNWAGQLGDGRAINLGEMRDVNGQHQMLQLKGAGPTPYSRTADGLAVLRSSLREYLCSEAMHHLGIPTTRALSLVATGETVVRDMFYDGNPKAEPGAVVCRVAPSFLRFGSYEIFSARNDIDGLRTLANYTIARDFPELPNATAPDTGTYTAWFDTICQRTARLIVDWMRVGFVHGVMNTDNMSILGLTIDYGPYGWLEPHDPTWTPNTTDAEGRRYRFGQQPQIAMWNLVQLANALYPLINEVKPLEDALDSYRNTYEREWLAMMRRKLGLAQAEHDDKPLVEALLQSFSQTETDYTLYFRALARFDASTEVTGLPPALRASWYDEQPGTKAEQASTQWLQRYRERLLTEHSDPSARAQLMNATNPLYVLRNWLAQQAIDDAEQGKLDKLRELEHMIQRPYTGQAGKDHLAQKRPEWARQRAGCSMLSCSS